MSYLASQTLSWDFLRQLLLLSDSGVKLPSLLHRQTLNYLVLCRHSSHGDITAKPRASQTISELSLPNLFDAFLGYAWQSCTKESGQEFGSVSGRC